MFVCGWGGVVVHERRGPSSSSENRGDWEVEGGEGRGWWGNWAVGVEMRRRMGRGKRRGKGKGGGGW
jgi:hypothetical protein